MRRWTAVSRLALALPLGSLLILAAGATAVAGPYADTRDGSVVGANAGWGWTQVSLEVGDAASPDETETDVEDALGGILRYSFAPDDAYMYGIQAGGWKKSFSGNSVSLFFIELVGTWFPGERGYFVRGSGGYGSLDLTVRTDATDLQAYTVQKGGWSLGAGAGYEWRLQPEFALGIAFDAHWSWIGDVAAVRDVKAVNYLLSLNFNYYL